MIQKNYIKERHIRFFLSSTFLDMNGERDYIMRRLFPKLRKVAADRDVITTIVDLRWGIPFEYAINGKTLESCLREIDNSIPFFIGLVGNRYGWVPKMSDVSEETKQNYPDIINYLHNQLSITEIEIQYGVLNREENMHAYFFFRSEEDGESIKDPRITSLKSAIQTNNRYPVAYYSTPENLGAQIESHFLALLDHLFPNKGKEPWEKDQILQLSYIHRLQKTYIPDGKSFGVLDKWLENDSLSHLVVFGEPGCGKSALLANWMKHQRNKKGGNYDIVYYSVGGGSGQNVWSSVAESLVRQIIPLYNLSPITDKRWEETLKIIWGQIEVLPEIRLLIILDAVDQLDLSDSRQYVFPLPIECPENIKILLSTREGDKSLEEFKARNYTLYRIEPLQDEQRKTLISDYLSLFGKYLNDNLIERITESQIAENSLQLKTLLDELITWGNELNLERIIMEYISETTGGFYMKIFMEYQAEFGESCLKVLSYIALSRKGLSESDILGISELAPIEWSVFSHAIGHYLIFKMGVISFTHDYLKHFFMPQGPEEQTILHERLGEWFIREKSNRATVEAMYHFMYAGKVDVVESLIKDPDVFYLLTYKDLDLLHRSWSWLKGLGKKTNISHFFTAETADFDFCMRVSHFLKERVLDYDLAACFANSAFDEAINDEQRLAALDLTTECDMLYWEPSRALKCLEASQKIRENSFGKESLQVAKNKYMVGRLAYFFVAPMIAIPQLEEVLQIQRIHANTPLEDLADTLFYLGASYVDNGRFCDADTVLEEAEQFFLQKYGSYSTKYLTTLVVKSRLEILRGNYNNAVTLIESVNRKLDTFDTNLLYIYAILIKVEIYGRQGDSIAASNQFLWVFNRLENIYRHRSDISPDISLLVGQSLYFAGFERAAVDFMGFINPWDNRKRFPVDYLINGKRLYQEQRYQEAQERILEGIELSIKYMGEYAPITIELRHLLGLVLVKEGDLARGLENIRLARFAREKIYGANHPLTLSSRLELCRNEDLSPEVKYEEIENCLHILTNQYGMGALLLQPFQFFKAGLLIQMNKLEESAILLSMVLETEVRYLWKDTEVLDEAESDLQDEIDDAYQWYQQLDAEPYEYLLAVLKNKYFSYYGPGVKLLYYTRIAQHLLEFRSWENAINTFVQGHKIFLQKIDDSQMTIERAIKNYR